MYRRLKELNKQYIIAAIIFAICIFLSFQHWVWVILLIMFGPIGFGAFVTWNQEEKQTIRQKIKFEEVTGKKFSSDDEYTDDYKKFKRQHSYLFDNTPKVAGWGVGIAFAIVLIIIGKSPIHDEARSSKSSTSYSSKQKRDYLKKLEGAAGKYYDKNCARSTSGC